MFLQNRGSERGSSIAIVIVAIGLISVVTFASTSYLNVLSNQVGDLKKNFLIGLIKNNISKIINSPTAWQNTVADSTNSFASCQVNPAGCLAISEDVPLILKDAENNLVVAGETGTQYSFSGEICTQANCPVLVKTKWRGVCDSEDTCTQIVIDLEFQTKDTNGNSTKSNVTFLKNYFLGTAKKGISVTATYPRTDLSIPTAKIIVIMDNSESMIDNFAKVKKGLQGTLAKLAGHNAEVYFYTTNSLEYFANFKVFAENFNASITNFKTSAPFISEKVDDFNYKSHLSVDMSRKLNYPIDSKTSAERINTRLDAILAAYVPTIGSDRESGLCTLHRIISDDGPHNPLQPDDLAFFILATDENDAMMDNSSSNYGCNKAEVFTNTSLPSINYQPCDPLTGSCTSGHLQVNLRFTSASINAKIKVNDTYQTFYLGICGAIDSVACSFKESGSFPCTAKELAIVDPTGTKQVTTCTVQVNTESITGWGGGSETNPTKLTSLSQNACGGGAFTYLGVNYTSLQQYVVTKAPGKIYTADSVVACNVTGMLQVPTTVTTLKVDKYLRMTGELTSLKTINTSTTTSIKNDMINKLQEKFGSGGYSLKAFIHDPIKDAGLCTLTDGTYGTAYKDLILSAGNPASSYESICNDDYGFSFESLTNTIMTKLNNTFIFSSLAETDVIQGISLSRAGASFSVPPDKFEIIGNKVIFSDGQIQNGDIINLILKEEGEASW